MAYYFWHRLDFQGSRVSGAIKVRSRIDAINKLRNNRKDITSGVSVSEAFSRHSGFPEPVLKQLSMVQSVDDLGTGFEKNVQYYEESITRNTAKLNAMIEPLMMVFLAGMVLVFLLALYLPLFQLGEWI